MGQRELPESIGGCRIRARLGQGGMGETFLAVRTGAGGFEREVAIKVIRPDQADDPALRELFLREGKLAGALHHRAIVQVFDAGVDGDGRFYLVMEYLRGVDLRRLTRDQGGRLPWRAAAWAVSEAARGLAAAHELGVIHRDVSPSNVMACADGAVKLLDFGLARPAGDERSASRLGGKLPYIAPELANGGDVDHRADLYALGVVLYWLMTGQQPFEGRSELEIIQRILLGAAEPPSAMVSGIPEEIDALVARAMARDPAARFTSGAEMADALDAVVAGGFGAADLARIVARAGVPEEPRAVTTESAGSPRGVRRAGWWVAGGTAAVALASLLVLAPRGGDATERRAAPPAAASRPEPPRPPPPAAARSEASAPEQAPAAPAEVTAAAPRPPARARGRRPARPAEPAPAPPTAPHEADVQPDMPIRY